MYPPARLLDQLVHRLVGAVHHQGELRDGRVLRGGHGERVDIETARGKQPGHAHQGAGFVLQQDGKRVFHESLDQNMSLAAPSACTAWREAM